MCKATSSQVASQGDNFPLFHVVLIDAHGKEHGFIGYTFQAAGAQAAANGWNAQTDRSLTAVIRDGLPVVAADIHSEAPSNALDAMRDNSDSVVDDDDESEPQSEPAGSVFGDDDLDIGYLLGLMVTDAEMAADRGDLSLMSTLGLRYTLMRYLQSVIGAIYDNQVRHPSDVGMIAKGLELFCARIIEGNDSDECKAFSDGQAGNTLNDYGTMEALTAWIDSHADCAVTV